MITAFQADAYQSSPLAYQIGTSAATTVYEGVRIRARQLREQALREDQELIGIIKQLMPFIDGRKS